MKLYYTQTVALATVASATLSSALPYRKSTAGTGSMSKNSQSLVTREPRRLPHLTGHKGLAAGPKMPSEGASSPTVNQRDFDEEDLILAREPRGKAQKAGSKMSQRSFDEENLILAREPRGKAQKAGSKMSQRSFDEENLILAREPRGKGRKGGGSGRQRGAGAGQGSDTSAMSERGFDEEHLILAREPRGKGRKGGGGGRRQRGAGGSQGSDAGAMSERSFDDEDHILARATRKKIKAARGSTALAEGAGGLAGNAAFNALSQRDFDEADLLFARAPLKFKLGQFPTAQEMRLEAAKKHPIQARGPHKKFRAGRGSNALAEGADALAGSAASNVINQRDFDEEVLMTREPRKLSSVGRHGTGSSVAGLAGTTMNAAAPMMGQRSLEDLD